MTLYSKGDLPPKFVLPVKAFIVNFPTAASPLH